MLEDRVIKLIITDTHFGVKNNSLNFLNSQLRLFKHLEEYIKKSDHNRYDIVHLGDIFDSRSTISVYIQNTVQSLFRSLYNILIKKDNRNRLIFVGGNHDYYSPDSDNINSLDTIIKPAIPEAIVVSREYLILEDDLYAPWYTIHDSELIDAIVGYNRIFTHTDLLSLEGFRDKYIYSGHIHKYCAYREKHYNLSAPYSINFNDANDDIKGIWVLDGNVPELIQNNTSTKFIALQNDDIFNIQDLEESISRWDNYNLYISKKNLSIDKYIKTINELTSKIRYINVIPVVDEIIFNENVIDVGQINIDNILNELLCDHLQPCIGIIKDKIKQLKDDN